VTEAHGDLQAALDLYEDAAERWNDFGFGLERGHALLGAGRCLLTLGRGDEGRATLNQAETLFHDLDAKRLIEELRALLTS
jgi:tetratricopeptide (TPR) repeat protein